jgi:hypothetical protein
LKDAQQRSVQTLHGAGKLKVFARVEQQEKWPRKFEQIFKWKLWA